MFHQIVMIYDYTIALLVNWALKTIAFDATSSVHFAKDRSHQKTCHLAWLSFMIYSLSAHQLDDHLKQRINRHVNSRF